VNKFCILVIVFIFISVSGSAQYKVNKLKYDYHDYTRSTGDRYDPIVAGVTSSLLPGLGQIISGEPGRGITFLGAFAGCAALYITGIVRTYDILGAGISGEDVKEGGLSMMLVGGTATLTILVWSVVDAVRVAKVNNLAWRDKRLSFDIDIEPFLNIVTYPQVSSVQTGVTFILTF
jgi:TM2 domain-containing membrane protein YozV